MQTNLPTCADAVLHKGAAADLPVDPDDAELVDRECPWGTDVFAVARLRIGENRLINSSRNNIRRVAEELERIAEGHGSGNFQIDLALSDMSSVEELQTQYQAVKLGVELVRRHSAEELARRLYRLQDFLLLIDDD